jgi:hypothetical protein
MPVRKTGVTPSPSPQTVVHQTNNFSIGLEENAKLNKAWRKLNEKHMSAP